MRGMNSVSVDLIYLDPPFNSKTDYAAPIGSQAAGAAFKDTWGLDDINLAWHGEIKHEYPGLYSLLNATRELNGDSMMSYLIYMSIRIMEIKRLIKRTGSIYLHCDPTASHYIKLLMDCIFGKQNFRNEIVWCYRGGGVPKHDFARKHDVIFRYSPSNTPTFNVDDVRIPYSGDSVKRLEYTARAFGSSGVYDNYEANPKGKHLEDWWPMQPIMPSSKERTGYPTQKPLALLERIIRASSNEGDIVLDPFCGCATACIASEKWGRQWTGIDISSKVADLVQDRMCDELGIFFKDAYRTDIPSRTDLGNFIRYNDKENRKWLYREQGGYCNGCEVHFPPRNMTVDHIIPRSKGGTDHISNLQLLCGACNSTKGDRPQEFLLACLIDKGWIKRKNAA